mmetsp:Transcript_42475/g.101051  ORF Transcript_42475/g.101051 Transcript_42475/m.101051 type:complete len:315 (+) Transcript_42475:79-1023(+)
MHRLLSHEERGRQPSLHPGCEPRVLREVRVRRQLREWLQVQRRLGVCEVLLNRREEEGERRELRLRAEKAREEETHLRAVEVLVDLSKEVRLHDFLAVLLSDKRRRIPNVDDSLLRPPLDAVHLRPPEVDPCGDVAERLREERLGEVGGGHPEFLASAAVASRHLPPHVQHLLHHTMRNLLHSRDVELFLCDEVHNLKSLELHQLVQPSLVRQLVEDEVRHRALELLYKRRAQGMRYHHAPPPLHMAGSGAERQNRVEHRRQHRVQHHSVERPIRYHLGRCGSVCCSLHRSLILHVLLVSAGLEVAEGRREHVP